MFKPVIYNDAVQFQHVLKELYINVFINQSRIYLSLENKNYSLDKNPIYFKYLLQFECVHF